MLKRAGKNLTPNHHGNARHHDVGYADGGSIPRAGVHAACLPLVPLRPAGRTTLASRRYVRSSLLDCRPRRQNLLIIIVIVIYFSNTNFTLKGLKNNSVCERLEYILHLYLNIIQIIIVNFYLAVFSEI